MNDPSARFESELRISHELVIGMLVILGIVFFLVGDSQFDLDYRSKLMQFTVLLCTVSIVSWSLGSWKPQLGRWFTIISLVVTVFLANSWLSLPGGLILTVIPIGLATVLIGLPAAAAVTIGESVLLTLLPQSTVSGLTMVIALSAIWITLGVFYLLYRAMHQLNEWLAVYFERAQCLLEETLDRKVQLEQTLGDLANANRQLALANERMATLRAIAEEAQRAKTVFVSNVSHEFRTPLNMIVGLIELMVETPEIYAIAVSPTMREDLETIHRNCEHLSSMINDVLDLTQAEAGRLALHKERVDFRQIIERSVVAVRPLLEKKQLAVQVMVPDDLPEVYCDRTRVKQVILNLLSNAVRYTDEGGITVNVAHENQHLLVNITDTGPGILPEDADRIFEPFCQGKNVLWRDRGGSGLGLSISKQFIKLHGGNLWFESKVGVGTTFFFMLPVSPPLERVSRAGHWIKEDWVWREHAFRTDRAVSAKQLVKPRIVICDDTGSLHPEFVRYSDAVEFVESQNVAQAIVELQQCPAHAVVLNTAALDNPWPTVETLREEAPDTPIIGCSVPPLQKRAVDAGALGHLIKPVKRADFKKAIQAVGRPVSRVLVVDDDPHCLQLFTRMLRACDSTLEVITASSGKQALEEQSRTPCDLMLLDIVMPDMDGWRVLELMDQDKGIRSVPTFFMSALDPANQPLRSEYFFATMAEGLSLSKLLHCCLQISTLLLKPEEQPYLVPV